MVGKDVICSPKLSDTNISPSHMVGTVKDITKKPYFSHIYGPIWLQHHSDFSDIQTIILTFILNSSPFGYNTFSASLCILGAAVERLLAVFGFSNTSSGMIQDLSYVLQMLQMRINILK